MLQANTRAVLSPAPLPYLDRHAVGLQAVMVAATLLAVALAHLLRRNTCVHLYSCYHCLTELCVQGQPLAQQGVEAARAQKVAVFGGVRCGGVNALEAPQAVQLRVH